MYSAKITAIGMSLPTQRLTNRDLQRADPELVRRASEKSLARAFSLNADQPRSLFDQAMAPYVSDPFRGSEERWVLGGDEKPSDLEVTAASRALAARGITPADVDLVLLTSFLPDDYVAPANASIVARRLRLDCPVINVESACSSVIVALQMAASLVTSGAYRRVLVVASSTYSRVSRSDDTLRWFGGDAGGALLVEPSEKAGVGMRSFHVESTAATHGAFEHVMLQKDDGRLGIEMRTSPKGGQIIRDTGVRHIRSCCFAALDRAGLTAEQINLFLFNTPLAWYAALGAVALDISPNKTMDLYPSYANIGCVLTISNLFHAARSGRLEEGDHALLFAIGSASTASAAVLTWPGSVALGEAPWLDLPPTSAAPAPGGAACPG